MNKKCPPGGNVFQQTGNIVELVQDIIGTNLLTKFYNYPTINVASTVLTRQIFMTHNGRQTIDKRVLTRKSSPPPGAHVFQPTGTISKLVQDIIETNLLTKFHDNQTINMASRVKNAPPLGSHVFQANTNLLTKFHKDNKCGLWSFNKANVDAARRTTDKRRSQKLTMSTLC
ncbi:hypothetical protein DPMN_061146 [Dreissena polymorpha]|uniref:Uncharacterized protein n=1 Tax=Dreissena polymorpha TaxID=45954 RepID=A0A9D4C6G6_DREPO|nr:hypothetical protein DPMN_061146 [Dreissena polymorpha]